MNSVYSNIQKKSVDLSVLESNGKGLYIYRGDIASLNVDCIVCGMPMCKKCSENVGDMYPLCIHVPGLYVEKEILQDHIDTLKSYYTQALTYADKNNLKSIAFCTMAVDMIPSDIVCKIAVESVMAYKEEHQSKLQVVFTVKRKMDKILYQVYMNE